MAVSRPDDLFGLGFGNIFDDEMFGFPIEPLHDFSIALEAADIESLLAKFEENEKNNEYLKEVNDMFSPVKTNFTKKECKKLPQQPTPVNIKHKSTAKRKKCGISLLAKPLKMKKQQPKKILESSKQICPSNFASYFYQDHDYCPKPYLLSVNEEENVPTTQDLNISVSSYVNCNNYYNKT